MKQSRYLEFTKAVAENYINSELKHADECRLINPNSVLGIASEVIADLLTIAVNAIQGNSDETAAAIAGLETFVCRYLEPRRK